MTKFALALVALGFVFAALPSHAAQRLPDGSYQQTCKDVAYAEHTLGATCQMRDGGWAETMLRNPEGCPRGVANENGQLRCDGFMPLGSYNKTCRNMSTKDGTIYAGCQRRDGSWMSTSLEDAWACNGWISNQDGQLTCDNPQ